MIHYYDARKEMQTGDVLMVKASGFISRIVRVFTGESINHIAMIIRNPTGVFVVEMREGAGWLLTPASQWMEKQKGTIILFGQAPEVIRGSACNEIEAMLARGKGYSYLTLIMVWISQLIRRPVPNGLVCSTFIQKIWSKCGYKMSKLAADPGDFMEHATRITAIK